MGRDQKVQLCSNWHARARTSLWATTARRISGECKRFAGVWLFHCKFFYKHKRNSQSKKDSLLSEATVSVIVLLTPTSDVTAVACCCSCTAAVCCLSVVCSVKWLISIIASELKKNINVRAAGWSNWTSEVRQLFYIQFTCTNYILESP